MPPWGRRNRRGLRSAGQIVRTPLLLAWHHSVEWLSRSSQGCRSDGIAAEAVTNCLDNVVGFIASRAGGVVEAQLVGTRLAELAHADTEKPDTRIDVDLGE